MLQKYSFVAFCKDVITATGLSVVATLSVPSQVFSLTTEIPDIQKKTVQVQELKNDTFTNLWNGEKSNLLIADKYDDDDDDKKSRKRKYRYDDDDKKSRKRKYRKGKYRKGKYYRSSKYYKKDKWNCHFTVGRLVNSDRKSLVLYLDILEKPVTKYANVVYTVYARQNNKWVRFYSTTGARLIKKRGKRYFLKPEIIEYSKLRSRNLNLSKSDLRFVTQIRYDTKSKRDQKLVFEDTWNYNYISEINSVTQLTTVSSTTTTETQDFRNSYRSRDSEYRRDDYRRDDKYRRDKYRRDDKYGRDKYRRDDKYGRDKYRRDDDYRSRRDYRGKRKFYSSKAFKVRRWNGLFKVGRLVNSKKEAFVLHLDLLDRPAVKDAKVIYAIYARQNRSWVRLYRTKKGKLISKKGKRYFLKPTVIDFKKLRLRKRRFSKSDLRFVTEIRYKRKGKGKGYQTVVFENVWKYRSITKMNSVRQITYSRKNYRKSGRYDD